MREEEDYRALKHYISTEKTEFNEKEETERTNDDNCGDNNVESRITTKNSIH